MKEFTNGDTIWMTAVFRTNSGALFDPSSTWGKIYDASSVMVQSISALIKDSTGVYKYGWQSNPASHQNGPIAFEAFGEYAGNTYRRRGVLFKLV